MIQTAAQCKDCDLPTFHGIVAQSEAMHFVFERVSMFARANVPILVEGETGVGKDMVVRALYECSGRKGRFVDLNCAAIPDSLVESELFGHERGAFTGAIRKHKGLIANAHGGILFLDEMSTLPLHAQAKLLRAIESGQYRPVGSGTVEHSNFRVVAASNEPLEKAVAEGRFRLDLLHRLGAARISIPPLRQRREDIELLANAFLRNFHEEHPDLGRAGFSPDALRMLRSASWPGNVRELRNVVETAAVIANTRIIQVGHISGTMRQRLQSTEEPRTLAEIVQSAEVAAIIDALARANGNREKAAAMLGVSVATVYRKLAVAPADRTVPTGVP